MTNEEMLKGVHGRFGVCKTSKFFDIGRSCEELDEQNKEKERITKEMEFLDWASRSKLPVVCYGGGYTVRLEGSRILVEWYDNESAEAKKLIAVCVNDGGSVAAEQEKVWKEFSHAEMAVRVMKVRESRQISEIEKQLGWIAWLQAEAERTIGQDEQGELLLRVLFCRHPDGAEYSWFVDPMDTSAYNPGDVVEVEHLGGYKNDYVKVVSVGLCGCEASDKPACRVVGKA